MTLLHVKQRIGIIIYKMDPPVNLFDDDSPKNRKKDDRKGKPTDLGTKDNKLGSSRRNRKRMEAKTAAPGTLNDAQPPLVAANHKVKFKNEAVDEDTDVAALVANAQRSMDALPVARTIAEEDDDGNTEYKLKLVDTTRERIQQLTTQMKFRIKEGQGEAFYKVGFEDNGNPLGLAPDDLRQSLNSLCHIANDLKVELLVQRVARGQQGLVAEVAVREIRESVKFGIKLSLLGASGSGKSSLVG